MNKRYSLIYADPPWSYGNNISNGAAVDHYSTMRLIDLKRQPVWEVASENAVLAMWYTGTHHHGDKGGAARFFYCAKVSKNERDQGMERFISTSASDMTGGRKEGSAGLNDPRAGAGRTNGAKNNHPTVKPIALMKYLCRLITPPGGKILDPWVGSGSTGCAAVEEGFDFTGIDMDPDHITTASARIAHSFKKSTEAA